MALHHQTCKLCRYSYTEDCGLSELGGLPHAPRLRCQGLVDPVTGHLRYYDCEDVRTDPTRGCIGFKLHEEDEL